MKYSSFIRLLLLSAVVSFAVFAAGCNDRGASEGSGFNNGSEPNGPNGPDDPNGPEDPCNDPTQLFTIDWIRPKDGATDISIGTDIIVNFSGAPEPASIGRSVSANLITLTAENGNTVKLSYRVEDDTAFFTPTNPSPLAQNVTYTFTIKNVPQASAVQAAACAKAGTDPKYLTITDDQGNPVDEKDVIFTTGTVNDLAIVSTNPADGGQASSEVTPTVTFNQQVLSPVCNGANAAITVVDNNGTPDDTSDDGSPVAGACSLNDSGNVVTFDPDADLPDGDYRLTIKAAGIEPKNQYAGPLEDDEVVDFSVTDITNIAGCSVAAGDICVLDTDSGNGLVDVLLDEESGPLAPLAGYIDGKDKLAAALQTLLQSDEGTLPSHLRALLQEGNLQEGLQQLLVSEEGLRTILPDLLTGLPDLLTEGIGGLLQALATGTDTTSCDAQLGTVCLVGGDGQVGVLDMLIGDDGYLNSIGLSQQELVDILGQTLQSGDGSLQGLVKGLFQDGQLVAGLKALLRGNESTGGSPGLLNALQDIGANLVPGVLETLGKLLGVENPGGLGGLGDLLNQLPLLGNLLGGESGPLGDLLDSLTGGGSDGGDSGGLGGLVETLQELLGGLGSAT